MLAVKAERRSQAQRRDEAERRLLSAAVRLVGERGLERITLAEVGEAVWGEGRRGASSPTPLMALPDTSGQCAI